MLDIGWSEMGLILLVALIVIGPKDLPRVARQVGRWSAKARAMAREFHRSLDDMAREADLQDIKAEIDKLSRTDLASEFEETVDPEGELRRSLEPPREIEQKPLTPAMPAAAKPDPAAPAPKPEPALVGPVAAANAGEPPAVPSLPPAAQPAPTSPASDKG